MTWLLLLVFTIGVVWWHGYQCGHTDGYTQSITDIYRSNEILEDLD